MQTTDQTAQDQTAFKILHASTYLAAAITGTTAGYALNTAPTHAPTIRLLAAIIVGFAAAHLSRRILNHLLNQLWNAAQTTPRTFTRDHDKPLTSEDYESYMVLTETTTRHLYALRLRHPVRAIRHFTRRTRYQPAA